MTTKSKSKEPSSDTTVSVKIGEPKKKSTASRKTKAKVAVKPAARPAAKPEAKTEAELPVSTPRALHSRALHFRVVYPDISKPRPAEPPQLTDRKGRRFRKRKSRLSKKSAWLIFLIAVACTALLVFSGLKIFQWIQDNIDSEQQQAEAAEDSGLKEVSAEGEMVNPPDDKNDDYWYYINLPFYEVDFNALRAKNPDTVAFIHMNNTNVNYPVVQAADNDYYLHHAYDQSYNDAGWVFMDYRSTLAPLSENLILYGHGRVNGTVFGSLRTALTADWQRNKDNYAVWLSTPSENLLYQIFSIYTIDAEGYYLQQNFPTSDSKSSWLSTMQQRNVAPINTVINPSDHVLTLSTCLDDYGHRIVVQAKLIKRQPR